MAAVTIHSDSGAQENSLSLLPLFPHLFAMKWWYWMTWSLFFDCWILSKLFHSPLSLPSRRSPIIPYLHSLMEKAMGPHSSTLDWKIPWMEEPGGLQSTGSRRVAHDWATSLSLLRIGEGNGNPLQCSCLENPRDGEPGGLPSMGWHRVGHDWSDLAAAGIQEVQQIPSKSK